MHTVRTESDMYCAEQFKTKAGCILFTSNVHEQGPWQDEGHSALCSLKRTSGSCSQ